MRTFHLGIGATWAFVYPDGYFKFNPNVKNGQYKDYMINSHGFRGSEFNIKKAPGVRRIVALGDSATFGAKNKDSETYSYLLQQLLDSSPLHSHYEVINAGIPYIRSDQVRNLFEKEVLAMEPDCVILYGGWNDAQYAVYEANWFTSAFYWLMYNSELIAWMHLNATKAMIMNPEPSDKVMQKISPATLAQCAHRATSRYDENLRSIHRACLERNIQLIVMAAPTRSVNYTHTTSEFLQATYDRRRQMMQEKLDREGGLILLNALFYVHGFVKDRLFKIADEEHIPLVNAIPELDHHPEFQVTHVHISKEGNEILARLLNDKIRSIL